MISEATDLAEHVSVDTRPQNAPAQGAVYYVACPECGKQLRQPLNRLGGPTVVRHYCGEGSTYFMTMASGTGYLAYEFQENETWEHRYTHWIWEWEERIRPTVLLQLDGKPDSLSIA